MSTGDDEIGSHEAVVADASCGDEYNGHVDMYDDREGKIKLLKVWGMSRPLENVDSGFKMMRKWMTFVVEVVYIYLMVVMIAIVEMELW